MRQLSLSEKCVGSVCIYIKKDNCEADPSFILYSYAYRLKICSEIDPKNIDLLFHDNTWPCLEQIVISPFSSYAWDRTYFKIYAPRLTVFHGIPYWNVDSVWINFFEEVKKRMPLLEYPKYVYIDSIEDLHTILQKSQIGLTLEECFLYGFYIVFIRDIKDIIRRNNIKKFITDLIMSGYNFQYEHDFIQSISKVTHNRIFIEVTSWRFYEDTKCVNNDDTDVYEKMNALYDLCYSNTKNELRGHKMLLIYVIEFKVYNTETFFRKQHEVLSHITNIYPKIQVYKEDYTQKSTTKLAFAFEYHTCDE